MGKQRGVRGEGGRGEIGHPCLFSPLSSLYFPGLFLVFFPSVLNLVEGGISPFAPFPRCFKVYKNKFL